MRADSGAVKGRSSRAVKGGLVSTGSGDEERGWAADKRDFVADRLDEVADERDRLADTRDRTADDREAELDKWERQLDARAAELGVPAELTGAFCAAGRGPCRTVAGATEPSRGAGGTGDSGCRSG